MNIYRGKIGRLPAGLGEPLPQRLEAGETGELHPPDQPNRVETRLKFPGIQVNPADTSISFPPRFWPSRNKVSASRHCPRRSGGSKLGPASSRAQLEPAAWRGRLEMRPTPFEHGHALLLSGDAFSLRAWTKFFPGFSKWGASWRWEFPPPPSRCPKSRCNRRFPT